MNLKRGLFWALLIVLGSAVLAAHAQGDSVKPALLPIGVTDADHKVGYVQGAKGGVEALNLENGDVLWTTKESGTPLVAFGKLLVVQRPVAGKANCVRIAVLDTSEKGKEMQLSDEVVFPEWVSVGVEYGRTFSSQARILKGTLLLKWKANAFYAGGARPTPEIEEAARKEASGVAQVDLKSGKVAMLDLAKAPAEDKVKLPAELAKIASQQYWTGSDWKTEPFVVGKTVSALSLKEEGGNKATLSLKRWSLETGKPLETVELLRGKSLWPQVSLEGSHVFVHQAIPKEQLPAGDYAWWVFSLESGKQIAKFPHQSLNQVAVYGKQAYHLVGSDRIGPGREVQPRSLRAIDLATGKMAWERPVEGVRVLLPRP